MWEGLLQCERVCLIVRGCAPLWDGVPQCGRLCPSVGGCAPVWEGVPQFGRLCPSVEGVYLIAECFSHVVKAYRTEMSWNQLLLIYRFYFCVPCWRVCPSVGECSAVLEGVPQCERVCPGVWEGVPHCVSVCPSVGACAQVWEGVDGFDKYSTSIFLEKNIAIRLISTTGVTVADLQAALNVVGKAQSFLYIGYITVDYVTLKPYNH